MGATLNDQVRSLIFEQKRETSDITDEGINTALKQSCGDVSVALKTLRNKTFQISGKVMEETIDPTPAYDEERLLILRTAYYCCIELASKSASYFKFQTKEKNIDKTTEINAWLAIAEVMNKAYQENLARMRTADGSGTDPESNITYFDASILPLKWE